MSYRAHANSGYTIHITREVIERFKNDFLKAIDKYGVELDMNEEDEITRIHNELTQLNGDEIDITIDGIEIPVIVYFLWEESDSEELDPEEGYFLFDEQVLYTKNPTEELEVLQKNGLRPSFSTWVVYG